MIYTVYAMVDDSQLVKSVVQHLNNEGISTHEISILCKDRQQNNRLAHELHTEMTSGKMLGASIGAALGWIAGLGTLMIPGIGLFFAAGPAVSLLGGAAIGAAVGNLNGALVEMGISHNDVKEVQERIEQGQILIAVTLHDLKKVTRVSDLLTKSGAGKVQINLHGAYNYF